MKNSIMLVSFLSIGSYIASLYGGWSISLSSLCMFMLIDYLSGIVVAGFFHRSTKTKNGALESRAGLKGLFRKIAILAGVLIACRLDMLIGTTVISNGVITTFSINELISITENFGLMGLKMPPAITNAIEILKAKTLSENKKEGEQNDDSGKDS